MCWEHLRWAKDVCLDPKRNTKKDYRYSEFVKRLVVASLVSGVLSTVVTVLAFSAELITGGSSLSWASAFVFIPVYIVSAIFQPFISAAIFHFFGKMVFGLMRKGYKKTYNAAAYSTVPVLLFSWIPLVGGFVSAIWGIVVAVYAMSNQQKIKRGTALLVVLIPIIIAVAIAFVLALVAASFVAGALLGPGMMESMFGSPGI